MPEVSRFFGVIVVMNYNDHAPPYFHARYGELKAIIDIRTLRLLDGRLPPRVFGLVMEWAALHQAELLEDWELARQNAPLKHITPLE
jgi:hypothetical protein